MKAPTLHKRLAFLLFLVGLIFLSGCTEEQRGSQVVEESPSDLTSKEKADVPFVETGRSTVQKMLELANTGSTDVVYDLGSGDGRIPIMAAQKYGARAVGIEIRPELVKKARRNAKEAGVDSLVEFRQGDLFKADIREATVVTLYLLPEVNMKLRPKLFEELEPGTRVVSHDFDMEHWRPDTTWSSNGDTVYRWTISEEPPPFIDSSGE